MIWLAYLSFVAAIVWLASDRHTMPRHTGRGGNRLVRLLAGAVAASFAAGGAALVFEPGNVVALVVGGSLVLGAATYVAGLVRLVGGKGYELRAAGWLLLSAPLLIPSTLTLALPVAALLVIPVPGNETRGAERPRAGGHRPPGQRIPARPIDER